MAFFKKSESFRDLATRLQNPGLIAPSEIADVIRAVIEHPEASPRRLGFMLQSTHPRVREAGLEYIQKCTAAEAIDILIAAMHSVEGTLRAELARSLLAIDRAVAVESLIKVFNGPKPEMQGLALDVAAVDTAWRDWLPMLKQTLAGGDATLRRQATRILRRNIKEPTVSAILRDLLHDEDAGLRVEVILAFCDAPIPEIVEPFFARLAHEGPNEQERMIQALSQLSRRPDLRIEEHLFPILADESSDTRGLAVKLLAQMPDCDVLLRRFLVHCRGLVSWLRDRAIASILEMADNLKEPLLRLLNDREEEVRVQALTLAARIDDARVVEPAAQIFCSHADWWVRSIAADILGRYPTDDVLAILLPFVDDPYMRYSVVAVLAKIDRPESTAHLIECLADPTRTIRATAIDGLANRRCDEVIRAVAMTARHDPDLTIRSKAIEALRRFGEPAAALLHAIEEEKAARAAAPIEGLDLTTDLSMSNELLNPVPSPTPD